MSGMNEAHSPFEEHLIDTFRSLASTYYRIHMTCQRITGSATNLSHVPSSSAILTEIACQKFRRNLGSYQRKLRIIQENVAVFCDEMGIVSYRDKMIWAFYSAFLIMAFVILMISRFTFQTISRR